MPRRVIDGVNYYGGKSSKNWGSGRWVKSMLPWDWNSLYVETHGGMLGVMLSRPPTKREIANDLNGRVVNWWRVVRTRLDEFKHMLEFTPCAQEEFDLARATIDEGSDIERAWKFMIAVTQSLKATDNDASWAWTLHSASHRTFRYEDRLDAIGRRVESVQLDNRPAVEVIERMADAPRVVMYCDPPYANTHNKSYSVVRFDRERMLDALRQQRGRVAISGYGSEWDELGWDRHERVKPVGSFTSGNVGSEATEVLWTNYEVRVQGSLV